MNSLQWDLLTSNWALVAAAGLGVVGWVTVTLIRAIADRWCKHQWENAGAAVNILTFGNITRQVQPVRCVKCGEARGFTVADVRD